MKELPSADALEVVCLNCSAGCSSFFQGCFTPCGAVQTFATHAQNVGGSILFQLIKMTKTSLRNLSKEALHFKTWCKTNRWTTTKLSKAFEEYGLNVAPSTIWYWQQGKYTPRNSKVIEVLSEIIGFDAMTFSNFQRKK